MEQPFSFTADGGRRHGLLYDGGSPNAAVVAHPHPLFGGDMTSPVVEAVCGAFRQRGWTTLRFNFRGVGKSDGRFDDGPGEARDLAAAVGALSARGAESIALAGYSFGAWVVERHLRGDDASPLVSRVVMVAPPVALLPFPPALPIAALDLIVTGDEDAYEAVDKLRLRPKCCAAQLPLDFPSSDGWRWVAVLGKMLTTE